MADLPSDGVSTGLLAPKLDSGGTLTQCTLLPESRCAAGLGAIALAIMRHCS
jgi:hypothetical protein